MTAPPPADLAAAYAELHSITKVAARFGLGYATARTRLLAAGVTLGRQGVRTGGKPAGRPVGWRKRPGLTDGYLAALYAVLGSERKVAQVADVPASTVHLRLVDAGVDRPHSSRRTPEALAAALSGLFAAVGQDSLETPRDVLVARLADAGVPQAAIARAIGVSRQRVGAIVAASAAVSAEEKS